VVAREIASGNAPKRGKSGIGSACVDSTTRVVVMACRTSAASLSPAPHYIAVPQPRTEGGPVDFTTAVDDAAIYGTINSVHAGGLMSGHPAPAEVLQQAP
jgi:hypothetical protein